MDRRDGVGTWRRRRLHLLLCRTERSFPAIQKQVNVTTKLTSLDNVGTKYSVL